MNGFIVLDSNTFMSEVGLTTKQASALKHYLFVRKIGLVVLEVVAQECQDKLAKTGKGMREGARKQMRMLANFMGGVNGWAAPSDEAIEERSRELSIAKHLRASIWPTSFESENRAEARLRYERPPSHRKKELNDCIIWEHCLDILTNKDVIFVTRDSDFLNIEQNALHPDLLREASSVSNRTFRFFRDVESLLAEIKCKIDPVSVEDVFTFVYDEIATDRLELESNSGCISERIGTVRQTPLATDQREIVEVRLDVQDTWANHDRSRVCNFRLQGSCLLDLSHRDLFNLTPSRVDLTATDQDGTVRAVKGSYVSVTGILHGGPPPIEADTYRDVELDH